MSFSFLRRFGPALAALSLCLGSGAARAAPEALPRLAVTVFESPSQSVWIPTLIQQLGLDRKHGFQLEVTSKPSKVAYTDFASGADPVCYCAAIAAVARFKQQGADITLLWNIFNYDGYVVTNNPAITTPKDLEGRTIQADTITGSWVLGSWFLRQDGVDLSKLRVQSASGSTASLAELELKRIDGVFLNPAEVSTAVVRYGNAVHAFSVVDATLWKKASGADALPAIAIGVWRNWYAKTANQDLARRFYAANVEAQQYILAHPQDAAARIAAPSRMAREVLEDVFTRFHNLINIRPLGDYRSTIALLTQKLLPDSKQLPRPLTDQELADFVADFRP